MGSLYHGVFRDLCVLRKKKGYCSRQLPEECSWRKAVLTCCVLVTGRSLLTCRAASPSSLCGSIQYVVPNRISILICKDLLRRTPRRSLFGTFRKFRACLCGRSLGRLASHIVFDEREGRDITPHNEAEQQQYPATRRRRTPSFSKMSVKSMMGALSIFPANEEKDKERGRPLLTEKKEKIVSSRASSLSASMDIPPDSRPSSRTRSQSPFRFSRLRHRDPSPTFGALAQSDAESDTESVTIRPRNAYGAQSDDESGDDYNSDDSWIDNRLDSVTSRNTERNALVVTETHEGDAIDIADPLGEGVNVVIPPEPYFPTTLNATSRARRRKSKHHERLPLETSRPVFQRDRCTITVTHGHPASFLDAGRRPRKYVLASDLSDESRYALEWGLGTVLRDGDEMLIVTMVENESKTDPPAPNPADRATKLRSQQERQGLAYILVRQAISLLQRTQLHVTISCQAWHAKNARHMILDVVDYVEPMMVIVGSRGVGKLHGILLGSTSHYLVQKCSVPVMVARRRLKKPPRRSAHLAQHRARVSLAEAAGVDRMASKVDQDVAALRDQMAQDEKDRDAREPPPHNPDEEMDEGDEDSLPPGQKVPGE